MTARLLLIGMFLASSASAETFKPWRPVGPEDNHLFAPCPIAPWALPKHVGEHVE